VDLSALFVNYNSWPYLIQALSTLAAHPPCAQDGEELEYEVVVVDNASRDSAPQQRAQVERLVDEIGGKLILHDENGGYAKGMNLAYGHARGRRILVCNPDILFTPDAVTNLVSFLDGDPSVGAVAPAVYADPDLEVHLPVHILPTVVDLVRTTLGTVSRHWNERYSKRRTRAALSVWGRDEPIEEEMFGGSCVLFPRDLIAEIGFFDERYPLYYEDTDLGRRIRRAGRRIVRVGSASVVHLYDRSSNTDREEAQRRYRISRARYFGKWYGPVGTLGNAMCSRFLNTAWARKRAAKVAARKVRSFEWDDGRPVLRLPRTCERFVVEIAYEPFLFLAAATFGQGDRWVPNEWIRSELRESWMRVVDLSNDTPVEIGTWKYTPVEAVP